MIIYQWAVRHGVTMQAIVELQNLLGMNGTPGDEAYVGKKSEQFAQSQVVLEGARKGIRLWRNNSGALKDNTGRLVRFGLMNESKAMNEIIKSPDLVGIRPLLILPSHVGLTFGQFVGREAKPPGWRYTGTQHELAQLRGMELINSLGGDAAFATGEGSL